MKHFARHLRRSLEQELRNCCVLSLLVCLMLFFALPILAQDSQDDSFSSEMVVEGESPPEQEDEVLGLSPELSLFEEIPIVVSASKKPERVTTAPSMISVISAEDIERMGARTLMDVLRTVPGIEIARDQFGVSQIVVRGLREENSPGVKVLIDNHSLNDPITGGATTMYDDLSLKNVSRIEIIRGPASALYGANAFVSVIHVITKKADEIDGLKVSLGAGSFDSYNPSLLFGKVFDDFALTFSADYVTTNGADLSYEEDTLSYYDGGFSLTPGTMQEEREKLDLSWKLDYQNFSIQGKFLDKHRGPFLTNFYTLNDDSFEDTRHIYTDLKYHRYLTERVKFEGRLYADNVSLKNNQQAGRGLLFSFPDEELLEFPDGLRVTYGGDSHRYGLDGQVNLQVSKTNDLILGVEYEYSGIENVFFRTNTFVEILEDGSTEPVDIRTCIDGVQFSSFQHFAALFVQDHWQIRPALGLTLGLRGDYYSEFGSVLTPKAGLNYTLNPNWNFKVLLGSAFRVPSFMETFFVGTTLSEELEGQNNVFEDDDDLVVEELCTFELGAGYQGPKWFHANLNYFYSDLNKLVEVPEDEEARWASLGSSRLYKSIGGFDVHGLEAEITGNSEREIGLGVIPRIIGTNFRVNYSYQDARDSESGERVPDVARHKGNIGVAFNLSAAENGKKDSLAIFRTFSDEFSLYLNLFLCGERERSDYDSREALAGYGLLDLSVKAYDIFHTQFDLAFSVKNLLDEEYADPSPTFREDDEEMFESISGDFPSPGRSFFVEFQYVF